MRSSVELDHKHPEYYQTTYQGWNKGFLFKELLNARHAADCISTTINIVACFLHSRSEVVIVMSSIYLTRFGIVGGAESTKIFFLGCAPWTWTSPHVTDGCNEDSVCSECQTRRKTIIWPHTFQGNRLSR